MLYEILAAGVSLCSISQHHEQTDIILAFSFVPVTWPLCRTWFRIAKVFTGRVIILEVKQLPECCSVFRAHAVIEENVHRGINGLHTKADTHEHDQVSAVLAAHREFRLQGHGDESHAEREEADDEQCGNHDHHLSHFLVPVRDIISLSGNG